ncbi:MAG: hypothetical protein K8T10_03025 [Candidatus Eremiobacteraeota bacterium]|nr:hypothetical protein [Candidatus Eremiobacteraeota bacterium]
MIETRDRLICFFMTPINFFKEVEPRYAESTIWAMSITFLHALLIFLLGVRDIRLLIFLPIQMILAILVFSFIVFMTMKFFVRDAAFGLVYRITAYAYTMMLTVHLLIYPLIWLPDKLIFLILLIFFGGFIISGYLATTGLAYRLKEKPIKIFLAIFLAFLLCTVLNLQVNFCKIFSFYHGLRG